MITPTLMSKMKSDKSRLYRGPLNSPRPYSDITEVDPRRENFAKSKFYAIYRGFYDTHHSEEALYDDSHWSKLCKS